MIEVTLFNGERQLQPETIQEWLDLQPEAGLRRMFRGDVEGFLKFADRLRDLEQRFDRWAIERRYRALGSVARTLAVEVPR